jgi:hypothetical protein
MKGFKGFDKDLCCRGLRYEVGKEYWTDIPIALCKHGYHFCKTVKDVHKYYRLEDSRICEIEALGTIVEGDDKCVTSRIKIVREILRDELVQENNTGKDNAGLFNSGNWNSGNQNSGNWNSGDQNSGDQNSGDRNSGNWNSGNWNSGNQNSGNWNSGNQNSGNWNSGNWNSGDQNSGYQNSGDRNSGNFNSCDNSAGIFMSKRISYEAFNKSLTKDEFTALIASHGYRICKRFTLVQYRIRAATGKFGDFRYLSYKKSWAVFWNSLSFEERNHIRKMPYVDKEVFKDITGVSL